MKMLANGVAVTATYDVRSLRLHSLRNNPLMRVGLSSSFDEFTEA